MRMRLLVDGSLRRFCSRAEWNGMTSDTISTPSSAAALFFAVLSVDIHEERVFVLPLDGNGRALAKPILVSVGHEGHRILGHAPAFASLADFA